MKTEILKRTAFAQMSVMALMILCFIVAASWAETITISNGNFSSGADNSSATDWDEPFYGVYFQHSDGTYSETDISGRAASITGKGRSAIQQTLSGVDASDYDVYEVTFSVGYLNHDATFGDIYPLRVSIRDITNDVELAGKDIRICDPGVDSSSSPNVGMIQTRTVVLRVDADSLSTEDVALRFQNQYLSGGGGYDATAVIDNVSAEGFKRVAQWNFENDLDDELGNHDGTGVSSPGYSSSGVQDTYCLSLDGSSEYVIVPDSSALRTNDFSISAWAKVDSGSSGYRTVVSKRVSSPYAGYIIYAETGGDWSFWTGYDSGFQQLDGTAIETDEWTFLTATFEQTGTSGGDLLGIKKFYINGSLEASTETGLYDANTSSDTFKIGAVNGGSYFFDGNIDDVRYYDHALTASDAANLYAEGVVQHPAARERDKRVRVMTYNLMYGAYPQSAYDWGNGYVTITSDRADEMIDIINQNSPDVVCLQECNTWADSGNTRLQKFSHELDMPYSVVTTNKCDFKVAMLSKYPIVNYYWIHDDIYYWRNILIMELQIAPEYKLSVASLHFAWFGADGWSGMSSAQKDASYEDQRDELINLVKRYVDGDFVIGGDWNQNATTSIEGNTNIHDDVYNAGYGLDTYRQYYPANSPLDTFYVSTSDRITVRDCKKVYGDAYYYSDHLPVYVDLEIEVD